MEMHLTIETQAKLAELAMRTHRGTNELLEEAVDHLVTWTGWLESKVKGSIAAADRGEITSEDEVRRWIESRDRHDVD